MNNLIRLVKLAQAMFQAWRLDDKDLMDEILLLSEDVPKSKESLVQQDKKTEALLRKLLGWFREQPNDSNIITSLLTPKVTEIILLSPELEKLLNEAFKSDLGNEDARQLIFQIIKELRDVASSNSSKLLKSYVMLLQVTSSLFNLRIWFVLSYLKVRVI